MIPWVKIVSIEKIQNFKFCIVCRKKILIKDFTLMLAGYLFVIISSSQTVNK
jgi:hypothetical protein